jgi:hypothetical protein
VIAANRHGVEPNIYRYSLSKLKIQASIGMTGAMKTAPAVVFDVLLRLLI